MGPVNLETARKLMIFALCLTATSLSRGQTARDQTAGAGENPKPPNAAQLRETLAEVDGETISRGDVFNYVMRITKGQIPKPEEQRKIYDYTINALVNIRLLSQFLREHDVKVSAAELDEEMRKAAAQIKAEMNKDLKTFCEENGTTEAKMRDEIATTKRWRKYFLKRATDDELRRFFIRNADAFNGTQIRASHILLRVPVEASPAEKEKVKRRLTDIRAEIVSGKISFADAANKYTEDQNAADQNGGDLGYFPRRGRFPEDFSAAAFALKKIGDVSQPVETAYGYHLIQLTDRRQGEDVKFDQNKEYIANEYGAELQPKIMAEEKAKKKDKIVIKPMPDDFFPVLADRAGGDSSKKNAKTDKK